MKDAISRYHNIYNGRYAVKILLVIATIFITGILDLVSFSILAALNTHAGTLFIAFMMLVVFSVLVIPFWVLQKNIRLVRYPKDQLDSYDYRNVIWILIIYAIWLTVTVSMSILMPVKTIGVTSLSFAQLIFLMLANGVLTPIFEELSMRGLFVDLLFGEPLRWTSFIAKHTEISETKIRYIVAAFIGGLIYSVLHGQANLILSAIYILVGFMITMYYQEKHNIVGCILIHVMINMTVIIIQYVN